MFKRKKIKAKFGLTIQITSKQTLVNTPSCLSEPAPAEPDIRASFQREPVNGTPGGVDTFLSGKKGSRF